MSPMGRPEGEYRSAQHEGSPVSATDRPRIPTAGRARAGGSHAASGVAWRR
jgi:16S rRNA (guanine527-N7)-methyltransferase